jgi:hypothetical protein
MRWIGRNPSLIVQPVDEDDLAVVARYAFENTIPIGIRSGGHDVDGRSMPDGQLVIDLCEFRDLSVDPEKKILRCGAGILLKDMDKASSEYGLVVPSGTVSNTGVAGLTLGGGLGHNMRRFGATVDSLLSCRVITTDGRKLKASKTDNADLFWALRGGGGNFAVVTEFEFQAHSAGLTVGVGIVLFRLEDAKDILHKLNGYMKTAPRELMVSGALAPTAPMPGIPEKYSGEYMLCLLCVFTGNLALLNEAIGEVSSLGKPAAISVNAIPWTTANSMLDAGAPYGRRSYSRGGYLTTLADTAIEAILFTARKAPQPSAPGPSTVQNLYFMGGAISEDFDEDSVAFSREGAAMFWEAVGQWDSATDDVRFIEWANGAANSLKGEMRKNGYINLSTDQGPEWLKGIYGSPAKFQRLVDAKTKWDPKNLLRFNKNIKPRAA